MAPIGVAVCPECKQALKVPAGWVDQPVRCKHCRTAFRIRARARTGMLTWKSSLASGLVLGTAVFLTAFFWPQVSHSAVKATPRQETRSPAAIPPRPPAAKNLPAAKAAEPKPQQQAPAVKKPVPEFAKPTGRLNARELSRFIDRAVQHRLDEENVPASPLADDAEFLRRVYLDITGVIPPADKVTAFLDSKDPNKRARLIDELLANPLYGKHLADIWTAQLLPRTSDNRRLQAEPLERWFRDNFNRNKPWNQMVYELITASGSQEENGAVTFYVANPGPDKITDKVTQMFLGVRLQCAQCHNHPFTNYKQTEYWGMAAFFSKVRMNGRPKNAAKKGVTLMVSEVTPVRGKGRGKGKGFKLPEGAKIVPPKFLQGAEPKMDRTEPYRPVLAKWMASPGNPFVARAMANRTWAHFMGRGFTTPFDDMHDQNPVSHPVLLDVLAEQFAANHFDLKYLARAVCLSKTYQRTSRPVPGNESDDALFSHMALKVLSPEQLFDSLQEIVGRNGAGPFPGRRPPNARKNLQARNKQAKQALQAKQAKKAQQAKKRGNPAGQRAAFVAFFNLEEGADPTEYQAGIPQALRLMNAPQFSNGNALLNRILAGPGTSPPRVIEQLYLATLARRPTAAESRKLVSYVRKQENVRKGYGDVLWALVNSSEFALNH